MFKHYFFVRLFYIILITSPELVLKASLEVHNYEADHEPPATENNSYEPESLIEAYAMKPLADKSQKCPYESVDLAPQAKPMTSYKPTTADIDEMMRQVTVPPRFNSLPIFNHRRGLLNVIGKTSLDCHLET